LETRKAQVAKQHCLATGPVEDAAGVNVENSYLEDLSNQLDQAAGSWSSDLGIFSHFFGFYLFFSKAIIGLLIGRMSEAQFSNNPRNFANYFLSSFLNSS